MTATSLCSFASPVHAKSFVSGTAAAALPLTLNTVAVNADNDGATTTVLGLTGDDEAKANSLTNALRAKFETRGYGGGQSMSQVELTLTMGCDDPPAAACLAEGGKTLNVEKLVYGNLGGDAQAGYTLKIGLVDVATGAEEKTTELSLAAGDLEGANLEATSNKVADALFGPVETATPAGGGTGETGTPPTEGTEEGPVESKPKKESGNLIWGKDPSPPKWKYIGLGASAGLAVVALGTAIGTTIASGSNGPINDELLEAAAASLEDDKDSNDIDPNMSGDLCQAARQEPPGEPGFVTNAAVTKVCNKGDAVALVATISWVTFGVAALSTAAFTTLLFVRKKESPTAAALRRHGVHLGVAPSREGVMVGGGFRF